MDTFSANSLKILNESKEEFIKKYIDNLNFLVKDEELTLGNKFHVLICYFLKGFNIKKIEDSLDDIEKTVFEKIKNSSIMDFIQNCDEKFIEQPFFIKETVQNKNFYLTGRFDLITKKGDKYTIIDWKTKHLPKDPEKDIQTIVYLHSAYKLFKTKNIEMMYYSILTNENIVVKFEEGYIEKIKEIVSKILT